MKKLIFYLQNRQTQISSIILFVISVAVVVYLNPHEAKFKYEFQKGKPWLYNNLVAPFDFPVIKSQEQLEEEKEKIRETKSIFLKEFPSVKEKAIKSFEDDFDNRMKGISDITLDSIQLLQLREEGLSILQSIYDKGVLKPLEEVMTEEYGEILITSQGLSQPTSLDNYYTIKEAAEKVKETLSFEEENPLHTVMVSLLIDQLDYSITYDENTTDKFLTNQLEGVLPSIGAVQKGELIIVKGNLVDQEHYTKLNSLKIAYEGSSGSRYSRYFILAGQVLLVSILYLALYLFLNQFRSYVLKDISQITFILLNVLLIVIMARIVVYFDPSYIYLAPFPILPIIMRSFFDTRLALFIHIVTMLMVGFLIPNSFEFVFLQFVVGIFSIILVSGFYKRSQLFLTAGKITAVYSISYLSLAIIQEGGVYDNINWMNFAFFAGNGFLTLICFPLIYFEEKLFGLVSDVSLLELSDTNNPLLRELGQKAPGTFQHSMQVANLSEAAVLAIGGNALLVRTGALYHDIGKISSPMYFIENQSTGLNPHDELSFEESAEIIISHVKEGIKRAKKHNLPDLLIDFIRTHHGTSTVMYFYKQYIKNFPEEEVDLNKFTYAGPKPFSKETAVLMMADSVEAAARSLVKPDYTAIDQLVESIIDHQMDNGQFENADITLKQIKEVKKIFKKMLMNIYHVRIQYPE